MTKLGEKPALAHASVMMLWQQLGFATILYLSGLQAIPAELDDAAVVDGASTWQRMWFVTIPLLARTTVFVVVSSTVTVLLPWLVT